MIVWKPTSRSIWRSKGRRMVFFGSFDCFSETSRVGKHAMRFDVI